MPILLHPRYSQEEPATSKTAFGVFFWGGWGVLLFVGVFLFSWGFFTHFYF